ncbi:MAG: sensor histidine kinase [Paenibacillus sp.]|nr:sensor histidine kinase [Paenibacillus sp.]
MRDEQVEHGRVSDRREERGQVSDKRVEHEQVSDKHVTSRQQRFVLFPSKFGFFPYVWLIYIILPIINLQEEVGIKLVLGYVMIGLFTVTYRQLYMVTGKPFTYWLTLQMLLIVVLSQFYSPYNLYMGFFTANFIGWYTDHRKFKLAMLGFAAIEIIPLVLNYRVLSGTEVLFLLPFFVIMLVSPYGIRSMNRRQSLEQELDIAKIRIKELVKREERMRIARDLHDTLGHTLSLITLKSQLVEKLIYKDPERARIEAYEIQQTSRAALRQVRELVSDMRAVKVAEEIAEAFEILRTANIALVVVGDVKLTDVSDLNQNILSLCIKEAMTNIVKHSKASNCAVTITKMTSEVQLDIEDDGVGLKLRTDNEWVDGNENSSGTGNNGNGDNSSNSNNGNSNNSNNGNGIKGMAERLSLIEGSLTLTEGRAKGARLRVTIPLIVKERKEDETV